MQLTDLWGTLETVDATPRSSDGQLLFLMEMVDKMKPLSVNPFGSRIASVHNGSSLFTGDAGGGESNIRRHIIENDLLECIIQLPNNLFYNTGITTYIWLLSNNKEEKRKGKVLLIDASERYAKLRKNLGAKNCEFRSHHINEINQACFNFENIERVGEDGLAAKVFNNTDFGYYKVTIERPARWKAQFTAERIAELRYDKTIKEPMEWAYSTYGNRVYTDMKQIEKEILNWCEKNDIDLNARTRKALTTTSNWKKNKKLLDVATQLLEAIGDGEYNDFNQFAEQVDKELKASNTKLSAAEKRQILAAVSWYDEDAEKVIKSKQKLRGDKLDQLLARLDCTIEQLPNYGYYPSGKKDEYIIYETETDLRDTESIPLEESIHTYFLREVHPHVPEAWIDLDRTRIGYEISFNKYFYQHKPLRSIEEVTKDILDLEKQSEGLILEILNFD